MTRGRRVLLGLLLTAPLLLASCTDDSAVSSVPAELVTELAPVLAVDACPSERFLDDGAGHLYPDPPEGAVPEEVVVELVWCQLTGQHVVERRTGMVGDGLLERVTDRTLTEGQVDGECPATLPDVPALLAVTDEGTYRVALPRTPGCGDVSPVVAAALDPDDDRWQVTRTVRIDQP
ncbi:hypothetical protein DT076_05745 [Desertihabitans brevis]|uniref:Uncharacterized protein n=1 Tax=Desertihabitans brevis TaxID=2268447 RepID=A0A367YXD6_9ACTN|nr:hypothetical protein [Desertihabitans brevis]RCK70179.1 hypothetical protein DT076_05745 [Desertihabitans brevis]